LPFEYNPDLAVIRDLPLDTAAEQERWEEYLLSIRPVEKKQVNVWMRRGKPGEDTYDG